MVEDEPHIQQLLRFYLEDEGFEVEVGADDYVTKPFQLESLVARVHRLLRARSAEG